MTTKSKISQTLGLATLALLTASCAQMRAADSVGTSLLMTGSAQPATVAALDKEPWLFRFLLPTASANIVPALADSNNSTVNLSSAWVAIQEIKFKNYETEAEEEAVKGVGEDALDESKFAGPYVVDLMAATPESLGSVTIPAEGYRRVKMELHKVESAELPAGAPAEMQNNSLILAGTVNAHNFSYEADDETEISISGSNAIVPDASSDLLVNFKLGDLFAKIDLSGITADTVISHSNRVSTTGSACPLIDNSANDLYTCFRKGIEASGQMGKDHDGDGEFESEDETVAN